MKEVLKIRLSVSEIWRLFLVVAFPIHIWAILIGFWNFQNVVERSANLMDGLAYLAYALAAAFVESLILFLFLFVLSFLMPKSYSPKRILVHLGLFAFGIALWMMIEQGFAYLEFLNPEITRNFFLQFSRPYLATLLSGLVLLGLVILSIGLPFYLFNQKKIYSTRANAIFERLMPLSILYIALDLFAILFIVFRNI